MHLIVGLGNPTSKQYQNNRHNAGFIACDSIIEKYSLTKYNDKFNSLFYKGVIGEEKLYLIKPLTYMNNSGKAVSSFVNFFKIPIENILVIFDDLALDVCKVRFRVGGGDGGHNGIKSINSFIKNEYGKVKIGIGHPGAKELVHKYVLSDFTSEELSQLQITSSHIAELLPYLIKKKYDMFSAKINN